MIRNVLLVAMFVGCAGAAVLPVSPAMAQEGKGFFSFFNRSKSADNDSGTAPVYMTPDIKGNEGVSDSQPVNLGKSKTKIARLEDSPVFEEERRTREMLAKIQAREEEAHKAEIAQLDKDLNAQLAYNKAVSLKQHAEMIAQAQRDAAAGVVRPKVQVVYPSSAINPNVNVAAPTPVETTKPVEPAREIKTRHFFNRVE